MDSPQWGLPIEYAVFVLGPKKIASVFHVFQFDKSSRTCRASRA